MWKLTIKQNKMCSFGEVTNEIELLSEDLNELTLFVLKFAHFASGRETKFEIESIKVGEEENGV